MGVCTVLSYMELLVLLQSSSPTNPKMCEMQVVTCEKSMQGSSFLLYLSKFSRFYMTSVVVHRFAFIIKWKTKSAMNFTLQIHLEHGRTKP